MERGIRNWGAWIRYFGTETITRGIKAEEEAKCLCEVHRFVGGHESGLDGSVRGRKSEG
jgi:hypothetical protein